MLCESPLKNTRWFAVDKQARMAALMIFLAAGLIVIGLALAGTDNPECSDGIDNDGDNMTDYPNDPGCSSLNDTDETNCGDGVCEPEERTSCVQDCGVPGHACNDTDGGIVYDVQGTVNAVNNGQVVSATDSCVDFQTIKEWYCSGTYAASTERNCSQIVINETTNETYTGCNAGACY